jgi:hypothetical protein
MIPIKVCEFCNTDTMYLPLAIGTQYESLNSRVLRVHFCRPCQAEYVYWSNDGVLASIHLYTTINEKMYRWSMVPAISGGRLWHVGTPGIPGKESNKDLTLLKNLDLNSITPSNVEEKIRIYLPFL